MKLLIDECLSEELASHAEASHVRWIGKGGAKDWQLVPVILAGDWTFVTKNSWDFRGRPDAPGTSGAYGDVDLRAGLICLNGPVGMDLDMQTELFKVALDDLDADPDLVNHVLEVSLENAGDEDVRVVRYALPSEGNGETAAST